MFCPTCGSPISDDAKFCPVCGSAVGAAPAAPAPQPVPQPAPQPQPAPAQAILPAPQPQQQYTGQQQYAGQYAQQPASAPMGYGPVKNDRSLIGWLLLSIVTCGFYAYYWYYKIGNRLQANALRYGLMFQENGTTVLVWQIIGVLLCGLGPIFAMNIIIKNTNALATVYNTRLGARA